MSDAGSHTIDFGIDLGTTNSLIAKLEKGNVVIFKNPVGQKECLASAVYIMRDRTIVGDQAIGYAMKRSGGAITRFKRKMGTSETYRIDSINQSKTPVELSAMVLQQLREFVRKQDGVQPEAAVITIPASFDMLQSNATKEAAIQAGITQAVLLQEPIAASLAYSNKMADELKDGRWLVYDLGGGTFDVALVEVHEGELKVIDHEGNNFFGGSDLDALIVERILVPEIERCGTFENLLSELKSSSGKYHDKYIWLLHLAEIARVTLSSNTSYDIDLSYDLDGFSDDDGEQVTGSICLTRSDFESLIKEHIDETIRLIKVILTRAGSHKDVKFVLMVGGVTYTPFIRSRVSESLGLPVRTDIDPTNAVVIGAAQYAGAKKKQTEAHLENAGAPGGLQVKLSYNKTSRDSDEVLAVKFSQFQAGYQYRITRSDGAFDSGFQPVRERVTDDLPLLSNSYNLFELTVYDQQGTVVPTNVSSIQIAHGKYSVAGQPLPADCSLVVDGVSGDESGSGTTCELLFLKGDILPLQRKRIVEASKSLAKGSSDAITILVVEGPHYNSPEANQQVGSFSLRGRELEQDIYRGDEIHLEFSMSEDRELSINAYVERTGQEFKRIFTSLGARTVNVDVLKGQIETLKRKVEEAAESASETDAKEITNLLSPIREMQGAVISLELDDQTEERYKLEAEKRQIAQRLEILTSTDRLREAKQEYVTIKEEVRELSETSGTDHERQRIREITQMEHIFLRSENLKKIEAQSSELVKIMYQMLFRTPAFLLERFENLAKKRENFNDQFQANLLIQNGRECCQREDYEKLRDVIFRLYSLVPQSQLDDNVKTSLMGISLPS